MLRFYYKYLLCLLALLLSGQSILYASMVSPDSLGREGMLSNGLNYRLRHVSTPRARAEFRLLLRVGSRLEHNHERGYSHFLEHMGFEGLKCMPGNSLTRYTESHGSLFGIGLNAMTAEDRTIYLLSLPLDDATVVDTALLIMRDWLCGMSLSDEGIARERSIVREEIRASQQEDPFFQLKVGIDEVYSRVGGTLGTMAHIDSLEADSLRAYYQKWYQPSLATIMVVGDIDVEQVERCLHDVFAILPSQSILLKSEGELKYRSGINLELRKDTLRQTPMLDLIWYTKRESQSSMKALRERAIRQIALRLWEHRLSSLRSTRVAYNWYLANTDHLSLTIEGKSKAEIKDKLAKSIDALYALQKPKSWSREEFTLLVERSKSSLVPLSEQSTCEDWIEAYTYEALHGDMLLLPDSVEQLGEMIRLIKPEEVRQVLQRVYRRVTNPNLLAAYSYGDKHTSITAREIRQIQTAKRYAYPFTYKPERSIVEPTLSTPKVLQEEDIYKAHYICSEQYYKSISATEVILTNGVRLVLRPTKGGDSIVKISLFVGGGQAAIPDSMAMKLSGLAGYMELGGIARVEQDTLVNYMLAHNMALSQIPGTYYWEMVASSSSAKAKELVHLLREKMLRPYRAYRDFREVQQDMISSLGHKSHLERLVQQDAMQVMQLHLDSLLGWTIHLPEPQTEREVWSLSLDEMADYHCDVYSRTEGMSLIVVGNFDVEELKKTLVATFGVLPPRKALPKPATALRSTPSTTYTVQKHSEDDKVISLNIYYGSYEPSLRTSLKLKIMNYIIREGLLTRLRQESGLTYTPNVMIDYRAGVASPFACFTLTTLSSANRVGDVNKVIDELMTDLMLNPVGEEQLYSIKRMFIVNKREALTEDNLSAWLDTLSKTLKNGESLADYAAYEEILEQITACELRDMFADFIHPEHHLRYYVGSPH